MEKMVIMLPYRKVGALEACISNAAGALLRYIEELHKVIAENPSVEARH